MAQRAVQRRIVSVLFANLVGFTSLSEELDPEDVAAVQLALRLVGDSAGIQEAAQIERRLGIGA